MDTPLHLIFNFIGAIITILVGSWVLIPAFTGLPWAPTSEKRIRRALEMAKVQPGETIYDLGAGDGRVLIMVAKAFGARGIGIEISPVHCWQARLKSAFAGVKKQVTVRQGNFYKSQIKDADVVFVYLNSEQAEKIGQLIKGQLRDGARVVSVAADIPNWMPSDVDVQNLIFLYSMPPQTGNLTQYLTEQKA